MTAQQPSLSQGDGPGQEKPSARPRRCFLGWERPLAETVAAYLAPKPAPPCTDLSDCFVVVPTRQAGRRLQRALAARCAAAGSGLLPPRIETPAWFTDPARLGKKTALAAELACWLQLLRSLDRERFPTVFAGRSLPTGAPLAEARLFCRLRRLLAEAGYDCRRTAALVAADGAGEADLWRELARLEERYLALAAERGLVDEGRLSQELAAHPRLPGNVQRLVVAAVPDPVPFLPRILERLLATGLAVEVLVQAPGHLADAFDEWGRPRPEVWSQRPIDLSAAMIVPAGDPADQAARLATELGRMQVEPDDLGVCVADSDVTRPLLALFARAGLEAYDPAGRSLASHCLFLLLDTLRRLVEERSAEAAAAFLRHPDVLAYLAAGSLAAAGDGEACETGPSRNGNDAARAREENALLADLDTLFAQCLPASIDDLLRGGTRFPRLAPAWILVREVRSLAATDDPVAALEAFVERLFAGRRLDPLEPEDRLFLRAGRWLRALLDECRGPAAWGFGLADLLALMLDRAKEIRLYDPAEESDVEIEGWLEAPWLAAPYLVVAGMNEGRVPLAPAGHPWIGDSLASRLGLPSASRLFARDAFLLAALAAGRRRGRGRLVLGVGRWSAEREPLLPSRLLFLADDRTLVQRAARLFAAPPAEAALPARTLAFAYDLRGVPEPPPLARLTVSQVRDYLHCPFRYFLRHHCGMTAGPEPGLELDPGMFGSLAHQALRRMGQERSVWECGDAERIGRFLADCLDEVARRRFGGRPAVPVLWQLDVLRQRLAACGRVQAALAAEWEIVAVEQEVSCVIHGVRLEGRIDRIDRHRRTGAFRIIDYKIGDRPKKPADAHLASCGSQPARAYAVLTIGGKSKRWQDLQLPLYRLLAADIVGDAPVILAYWNVPKALTDVGVDEWQGFGDELFAAARLCVAGVLADVQARRFWPPSPRPPFDDFEELFYVLRAEGAGGREEEGEGFLLPPWLKVQE